MTQLAPVNKIDLESDGDEFSDTYDHVSEKDTLPSIEKLKDSTIIITASGESGINIDSDRVLIGQGADRDRQKTLAGQHIIQGTGIQFPGSTGSDLSGAPLLRDQNDINHHLALTIINLQQSVESISKQVNSLESKVNRAGSGKSSTCGSSSSGFWPFKSSTSSVIFFLAYPVVIYLVMDKLRRKNKA